jgi:outer membrane protein assembly factor BamB
MLYRANQTASLLFLGLVCPLVADDWPQWRGPNRDGVWREAGTVSKFTGTQLPAVWRAEIGSGYCGPTVAAGRVYVMDRQTEPKQTERILCFDARTGKSLWNHTYDCQYRGVGYVAGPRASVTIEDGRAYAIGTMGHFRCLDAASGTLVWSHDCDQEYNIDMPQWGIAAAPLLYKDLVIVQIGGENACVVAFRKSDGKEAWKALSDRAQYTAPIVVHQAGQDVIVCWTGDSVAGLQPISGKTLWRVEFKPSQMPIGVATPVVNGDRLFMTSFYDGSLMLRLIQDKPGAEVLWKRAGPSEMKTDALHSIIGTPVFLGDYIYGVDSHGELRCLKAENGDRVWEDLTATPKSRWSTIHFVQHGKQTWMFNERGELIIAELSPQGFREISRTKLLEPTTGQLDRRGGVCWSHPAFANGHVFARNDKELVCASLLTSDQAGK